MEYRQAVFEYFKERGERFLKENKTFEDLNKNHNESFKFLKKQKNEKDYHKYYHKHANLSATFDALQRKRKVK